MGRGVVRIVVISDIHANLVALDTVLDDLSRDQYDELVCLGDIATRGPQPRECLERIRGLGCPVVMGNTDHWLIEFDPAQVETDDLYPMEEIDKWCAQQLSSADRDVIHSFRPTIEMMADETATILFYHGSPRDYTENIFSTTSEDDLEAVIIDCTATALVGGHTHLQMLRRKGEKTLVNVGSVRCPWLRDRLEAWNYFMVAPRADYAMIDCEALLRLPLCPNRSPEGGSSGSSERDAAC